MTYDDMIRVIQAHKDGKAIELKKVYASQSDFKWMRCINPLFNFESVEYRVAPEAKPTNPIDKFREDHPDLDIKQVWVQNVDPDHDGYNVPSYVFHWGSENENFKIHECISHVNFVGYVYYDKKKSYTSLHYLQPHHYPTCDLLGVAYREGVE